MENLSRFRATFVVLTSRSVWDYNWWCRHCSRREISYQTHFFKLPALLPVSVKLQTVYIRLKCGEQTGSTWLDLTRFSSRLLRVAMFCFRPTSNNSLNHSCWIVQLSVNTIDRLYHPKTLSLAHIIQIPRSAEDVKCPFRQSDAAQLKAVTATMTRPPGMAVSGYTGLIRPAWVQLQSSLPFFSPLRKNYQEITVTIEAAGSILHKTIAGLIR